MAALRAYLAVVLACLGGYTLVAGFNHGWNLLPIFLSNLADMTWSGQFNFDFMTFLGLSGISVAWRHQITGSAIPLGIVAFFGGMMLLAPYLLWASARAGGDAKILLLGQERTTGQ